MAVPLFPQSKENQLLTWSGVFSARITATPTAYGLVAGQATAYAALHTAFATAYATANDQNTNSDAAVAAKDLAKENLLNGPGGAWELVDVCQSWPNMTDALRGELKIRTPDSPTPIPAPDTAPVLTIISTVGRTVNIRLRDEEDPDRRGKPNGVQGATILFFVGAEAPADPAQWIFMANTSKTTLEVEIPASVTAGVKVWFTAFWFNNRKESSAPATPQSTRVIEGLSMAA